MEPVVFQHRSPLKDARRLADRELNQKATPSEVQWLYDNPMLWLRALRQIKQQIDTHIAKDRFSLSAHKPKNGTAPNGTYLIMKAEFDRRTRNRLHVASMVQARIDELKILIGPDQVPRPLYGDLIDVFAEIAASADGGDLEAAADQAWYWAKRLRLLLEGKDESIRVVREHGIEPGDPVSAE